MKYLKETLKWSGYKNKIGHILKKNCLIQILVIGLKKWSIRKIGELYNVLVQFIYGFIFDCTSTCNSHMPLWTLDFPNRLVSLIPVSSWFLCVVLTVKQCLWLPLDGTAVCHRLTQSIRRCCNTCTIIVLVCLFL